jgi:hypothetical protein
MEFHSVAYPVVCSTNAVQFGFSCRHVEPIHVSLVAAACAIHGCYRRRFCARIKRTLPIRFAALRFRSEQCSVHESCELCVCVNLSYHSYLGRTLHETTGEGRQKMLARIICPLHHWYWQKNGQKSAINFYINSKRNEN